jgi:Ammonium Transporter Family
MTIFEACTEQYGEDALNIVQCVANWIETQSSTTSSTTSTMIGTTANEDYDAFRADMVQWLLVLTGALVFFMQAGFAMVCAGAIRKKNVNNTVRCILDLFYLYTFTKPQW